MHVRRHGTAALQVLPGCLLLHFAAADLQESQGDLEAARQVYQDLLPSLNPDEPLATPPPQVPYPTPVWCTVLFRFLPANMQPFRLCSPCLPSWHEQPGRVHDGMTPQLQQEALRQTLLKRPGKRACS